MKCQQDTIEESGNYTSTSEVFGRLNLRTKKGPKIKSSEEKKIQTFENMRIIYFT